MVGSFVSTICSGCYSSRPMRCRLRTSSISALAAHYFFLREKKSAVRSKQYFKTYICKVKLGVMFRSRVFRGVQVLGRSTMLYMVRTGAQVHVQGIYHTLDNSPVEYSDWSVNRCAGIAYRYLLLPAIRGGKCLSIRISLINRFRENFTIGCCS